MKSTIYELLYICSIILLSIWTIKFISKQLLIQKEGFQQKQRFLLKTDISSYDEFYSEIYDEIWKPEQIANYNIELILKTIDPNPSFSNMLDVGCGTGSFLKQLNKRGFRARGIDNSRSMSQKAILEGLPVTIHDTLDPMIFEHSSFTHIFCLDFTIYELENKPKFFKNCYHWLQNNGYLILHLADKSKFNAIIPAARSLYNNSGSKRLTKTEIDFDDFIYLSDFITNENKVVHKETFIDKESQHIRQNERTFAMESIEEITSMALASGFIAKGVFTMEDSPNRDIHQKIIILERSS